MSAQFNSSHPTILTAGGSYFNFLEPEKSEFTIGDVAHALSHICRYTGHCREFYSVAQHSVLVSHEVPAEDALYGLLHDAAEAFIGDVSRPLKALLPDYKELEKRIEAAVLGRFGLASEMPESVKIADTVLLLTEKRDLMPLSEKWACCDGLLPRSERIWPMAPHIAKFYFLDRFHYLTH